MGRTSLAGGSVAAAGGVLKFRAGNGKVLDSRTCRKEEAQLA